MEEALGIKFDKENERQQRIMAELQLYAIMEQENEENEEIVTKTCVKPVESQLVEGE